MHDRMIQVSCYTNDAPPDERAKTNPDVGWALKCALGHSFKWVIANVHRLNDGRCGMFVQLGHQRDLLVPKGKTIPLEGVRFGNQATFKPVGHTKKLAQHEVLDRFTLDFSDDSKPPILRAPDGRIWETIPTVDWYSLGTEPVKTNLNRRSVMST